MKFIKLLLFITFIVTNTVSANDENGKVTTEQNKTSGISVKDLKDKGYFEQPTIGFVGQIKYSIKYLYQTNKWMFFGACFLLLSFIYRVFKFFTKR